MDDRSPPESLPTLLADEARVVAAMVEKAMTTPDNYPMSLNAVSAACNQVSNRDPIVNYADDEVELTLRHLADRGLAKMVHRPGDRVVKYRHALDDALGGDSKRLALTAVLLLRGAQTPGELRQRTGRYVEFSSLPEVEVTLEEMQALGLVRRLERRPGQKEHRYLELLSPASSGEPTPHVAPLDAAVPLRHDPEMPAPSPEPRLHDEIARLREDLATLRSRFEALLEALGVEDG